MQSIPRSVHSEEGLMAYAQAIVRCSEGETQLWIDGMSAHPCCIFVFASERLSGQASKTGRVTLTPSERPSLFGLREATRFATC